MVSRLTYQRSYLARLSYVHRNDVHHWLVRRRMAGGEGERVYKTIMRFGIERLKVPDEFEVV
jgi:hypothetical protein